MKPKNHTDTHCIYNCQKIIVFSSDLQKILLCKRKNEADYDEVFSFIGGKMQQSDSGILEALKREKDEELGKKFRVKICPAYSANIFFRRKDHQAVLLPHYYAAHTKGEIKLNEEYSEYAWVPISSISAFKPKIKTIPKMVKQILRLRPLIKKSELVEI